MTARLILPLVCLLPSLAFAAEAIDANRIVSAATGDWDKNSASDLALLVKPEEGTDDRGQQAGGIH